jgi:hypothetical protein
MRLSRVGQVEGRGRPKRRLPFGLPVEDKQLAILPGLALVSPLGLNRHLFWHVVHVFLTTPTLVD